MSRSPPSSVGSCVPIPIVLENVLVSLVGSSAPSPASLAFWSRLCSLSVFLPPLGIDCSSSCFPRSALWPSLTSTHMCSFFSSSSSSSSFIFSYRFLWHMFDWHLHMFLLRSECQLHWLVWRRRKIIEIRTPTDELHQITTRNSHRSLKLCLLPRQLRKCVLRLLLPESPHPPIETLCFLLRSSGSLFSSRQMIQLHLTPIIDFCNCSSNSSSLVDISSECKECVAQT